MRPQKHRLALLLRYRDTVCPLHLLHRLSLANVLRHELERVKMILASIQKSVYGIPLKWENYSDNVTWGEACIRSDVLPLSLVRKGCAMSINDGRSTTLDRILPLDLLLLWV